MDQATESPINATCAEEASSAHVFKGSKKLPRRYRRGMVIYCSLLLCNKHLGPVVAVCNISYTNLCKRSV